jgi:hypothetical protein
MVDMGGFEDLFDLAIRDDASAFEVCKQCGAKGSLATTQFNRLQGAGSFVLIVGLKRLIGFGIRDAVDIQGDKFVDGLGEFRMLLEVSEFQFDDVLGFEELDGGDIEEVFGEIDGCIEWPIDQSDLGVLVLVSEGVFLVFGGQVIGGDDSDPFAGGFSGVGKDAVVGLDLADEGVDRAGRVCGPLFVVGQESFDLFEREVS